MNKQVNSLDVLEAGTGFMQSLSEMIHYLEKLGFNENLSQRGNHFECQSGKYKLFPEEFLVEKTFRFENSSDPDDNAIIYAISSPINGIKGLYIESYGIYQDDLSPEMLERLKQRIH